MQPIESTPALPPGAVIVTSSAIAWLDYDPRHSALYVQFRDGARYQYLEVPLQVYEDLTEAESKGAHFNRWVRPYFPGTPVRPEEILLG